MVDLGKCVILDGWHGHLNAGDDAFAVVISKILRRLQKTREIILFHDESRLLNKIANLSLVETDFSKRFHFTRLRWNYYQSKATGHVLGGGSLFSKDSLGDESKWWEKKAKAVAIGISVGPFLTAEHEKRTLDHLNKFDFVAFRDFESGQWAQAKSLSAPFVQAFDMAVLLPDVSPCNPAQKKSRILGVALTGTPSLAANQSHIPQDWFDTTISRLVAIARKHEIKLRCFSFCRNSQFNDDLLFDIFTKAGALTNGNEWFQHDGNPSRTLTAVAECSHFVTSRLHGAIFAYTAGVPLMFIGYHRKCSQFVQTVGFDSRFYLDLKHFNLENFANALEELILSQNTFQATTSLETAKKLAWRNFDFCKA